MELESLLKEVAANRASDLYLIVGAVPCMNVEGRFIAPASANGQRMAPETLEAFARQVMTNQQWREYLSTHEANLAYMAPGAGRFRINVFRQRGSIGIVFRRVVMNIPTLKDLRLPPILRDIALADRGIVLVTGSTGSGKSTSMASMIDYRNHLRSGHIVTIEDPIEFIYQHRRSIVTQREIGMDTMSYDEALKNSLRQAPQVLSIGEMRDAPTLQFALNAAETGHLVFATLHATTAALTIERVLHFYPANARDLARLQLASNLNAIICQRLVPGADGGRVVACEIMINTPRIRDLILRGDLSGISVAIGDENNVGMFNFSKDLYRLTRRGLISEMDALSAADSANDLRMKFRGMGIEPGSSWEDLSDPWAGIPDSHAPTDAWAAGHPEDLEDIAYTNEEAPPITFKPREGGRPAGGRTGHYTRTARSVSDELINQESEAQPSRVVQRYQHLIEGAVDNRRETSLDEELDI